MTRFHFSWTPNGKRCFAVLLWTIAVCGWASLLASPSGPDDWQPYEPPPGVRRHVPDYFTDSPNAGCLVAALDQNCRIVLMTWRGYIHWNAWNSIPDLCGEPCNGLLGGQFLLCMAGDSAELCHASSCYVRPYLNNQGKRIMFCGENASPIGSSYCVFDMPWYPDTTDLPDTCEQVQTSCTVPPYYGHPDADPSGCSTSASSVELPPGGVQIPDSVESFIRTSFNEAWSDDAASTMVREIEALSRGAKLSYAIDWPEDMFEAMHRSVTFAEVVDRE